MVFGTDRFKLLKSFNNFQNVETALVHDCQNDKKCIVKASLRTPFGMLQIASESEFIRKCKGQNIVEQIDELITYTHRIIILEYYEQGDLFEYFAEKKRFSIEQIFKMLMNITSAVKIIHDNGIVHNDLKLENIFVSASEDFRIGDFGLSFYENNPPAKWGGTVAYIPPEFRTGPFTRKIDIWSIGVITYILFVGVAPYGQENIPMILELQRKLPPRYDIPDSLWEIVSACLQPSPADRPTIDMLIKIINFQIAITI